jgi:hypothetical protein
VDNRDDSPGIAVFEPGMDAWLLAVLLGYAEQAAWFFNDDDGAIFVMDAKGPLVWKGSRCQFNERA